jgi:Na+:H+ antiporter, NhaA family
MLLGSRVPHGLRVFLMAVAVIDDLGAILIVAFFYTEQLVWPMLAWACGVYALLAGLNRWRVKVLWPYVCLGGALWFFILKSGVHPTVAGVLTALAIPVSKLDPEGSPLFQCKAAWLEDALRPWVGLCILPLFAFLNAGVSLDTLEWSPTLKNVPLGLAAGLIVGKPLGVALATYGAIFLVRSTLPTGVGHLQFIAMCLLCGIGFTMSLFIGGLAFEGHASAYTELMKWGVLAGSCVAASLGLALLWWATRSQAQTA